MRKFLILPLALAAVLAGGAVRIVQDQCGPFTDVTPQFCPFVLELYYLGITAGTSATTYSPDDPLTRGQAAVFVAKGLDQALARSSRRAALGQWWTTTPHWDIGLGVTQLETAGSPLGVASDGADVWTANANSDTVSRVRASDGKLLETWTGASGGRIALVAMGSVFIAGSVAPGRLHRIDPTMPAGTVQTVASNLGIAPTGIAFDGNRIWTANNGSLGVGSVSIITPESSLPWSVTTITTGFDRPYGAVFDGQNVWVTDSSAGTLLRLDGAGNITQTVTVGQNPFAPTFDGKNIWVPNAGSFVSIVSAASGQIIETLTGNGLNVPQTASFDGGRVLVTNSDGISIWNAATLQPLGSFVSGLPPGSACSDGINFWITLPATGELARF